MQRHLEWALLVTTTFVAAPRSATAQTVCLETQPILVAAGVVRAVAAGDIDGDGHLDLVQGRAGEVWIAYGVDDGAFAPPVTIAPFTPQQLLVADFDLDGRPDVLLVGGTVRMLWNQGDGTFLAAELALGSTLPTASVGDIDQDGDLDVVAVVQVSPFSYHASAFRYVGARAFAQSSVDLYPSEGRTALADVDGDGALDLLVANTSYQQVSVHRNQGGGAFSAPIILSAAGVPTEIVVADFDGGTLLDVAAIDLGLRVLSIWRGLGAGAFAPRLDVPFGSGVPFGLAALDLDADGDLDLVAPTQISGSPTPSGRLALFRNDGTAAFAAETVFATPLPLVALLAVDFDRDGDPDLVTVASLTSTSNRVDVWRNCLTAGRTTCAGDGSASPCPCANSSPTDSQRGCLNSTGLGAGLRGSGSLILAIDTCELVVDGMPSPTTAFFFQGTTTASGGQGSTFGDGLSCATGSILRLAVRGTTDGTARYPESGELAVSARGLVLGAGTRTYQVLYRNAAAYCTPATFNLSNGLVATWR